MTKETGVALPFKMTDDVKKLIKWVNEDPSKHMASLIWLYHDPEGYARNSSKRGQEGVISFHED